MQRMRCIENARQCDGDVTTTVGTGSENGRGTAGAVVGVASIVRVVAEVARMMRAVAAAAYMMRAAAAAVAEGKSAARPSSVPAAEAEAALCCNKIVREVEAVLDSGRIVPEVEGAVAAVAAAAYRTKEEAAAVTREEEVQPGEVQAAVVVPAQGGEVVAVTAHYRLPGCNSAAEAAEEEDQGTVDSAVEAEAAESLADDN
jgi:hypothetical protein